MMFNFCEVHGILHPSHIPDSITVQMVKDWERYSETVGMREDFNWGILFTLIANQNRGKGDEPIKMTDLMPYYHEPLLEPEEIQSKIKGLFASLKKD